MAKAGSDVLNDRLLPGRRKAVGTTEAMRAQAERGKAARADAPRTGHADFAPGRPTRPDPIGLLEEQAVSRVPELVPIRYGRMLASPFAFFRGAALIMASDLATTASSGLEVQACGDAHLANFGLFGTPERHLVFDLNDFDETLPGPWEWDVKRLTASLAVAGRERGFTDAERREIVLAAAESYRRAMRAFAGMGDLDVWYARLDAAQAAQAFGPLLRPATRKTLANALSTALTKDSMQAFKKLTTVVDGEPRLRSDPPLIMALADLVPEAQQTGLMEGLRIMLAAYRDNLSSDRQVLLDRFEFLDMARKVVGVGSVGTRAWVLLLRGRHGGDPLLLQAKEAQPSVLERYVGASAFDNHGRRVVHGQRLMQASSDLFLGWERVSGLDAVERDFYVRQLRDWKGSVDTGVMIPTGMKAYGQVCGWTLARAHARSGSRVAIAAYLGASSTFDNAIADFAESYADQNQQDYDALRRAVDSGRVTATMGL